MSFFPRATTEQDGGKSPMDNRSDAQASLNFRMGITNYLLNFNFMDDPCKSLDYILPIRESQSMMLPPFAYSRRPIVNVTRRFTERIKYKYEHESSLNEGRISKLYWLPDGKWLFFTQNEYIRHVNLDGYGNSRRRAGAYDDQSRAAPQRLFIDQDSEREFIAKGVTANASVTTVQATHNSQYVFFGTSNGKLDVYDISIGFEPRPQREVSQKEMVTGIAFAPSDQKYVVSCDKFLSLYDMNVPGAPDAQLVDSSGQMTACDWHPYNSLTFAGDDKGNVFIQDARDRRAVFPAGNPDYTTSNVGRVNVVSCNRNGNWVLVGSDRSVLLFDVRTMSTFHTFDLQGKCLSAQWDPVSESQFLTTTDTNSVCFWNANYAEPVDVQPLVFDPKYKKTQVECSAIHPMGWLLATNNRIGETILWSRAVPGDVEELEFERMFYLKTRPSESTAMKRKPDNYVCDRCRLNNHLPGECPYFRVN